jgi:hypothetical protein
MSDQQQQPSLIGGHAQYVKGAAEVSRSTKLSHPIPLHFTTQNPSSPPLTPTPHSHHSKPQLTLRLKSAVGAVTGSEAWNVSAQSDKQDGIDAMKAASEQRDANRDGFGKVEELAGKAAGCEGMEKEGAESKTQ